MSSYMDDILNCPGFSTTVTIQKINQKAKKNRFGDFEKEAFSTVTISGNLQVMSAQDDEVREGVFRAGDVIAFFNPSDTNANALVRGNRIVADLDNDSKDETYEINAVIHEPSVAPGEFHIEVMAKRI